MSHLKIWHKAKHDDAEVTEYPIFEHIGLVGTVNQMREEGGFFYESYTRWVPYHSITHIEVVPDEEATA